jgi:signal recognition particle subunit SRP19
MFKPPLKLGVLRVSVLSREYRGKRVVIYPVYFDYGRSRSKGRRVPRSLAVQNPSIDEIVSIALELGLNPEVVKEAKYPRDPTSKGRVLVDKYISKHKTILLIAKTLREKKAKSTK